MTQQLDAFSSQQPAASPLSIDATLKLLRASPHHSAYVMLALMGEKVPKERWRKALIDSDIGADLQLTSRDQIDAAVLKASEMGALLIHGTKIEVHPNLKERLARDWESGQRLDSVKHTLLHLFCRQSAYAKSGLGDFRGYSEAVCGVRLGFVSADTGLINEALTAAVEFNASRWNAERPLAGILETPTADDWLSQLPSIVAQGVLLGSWRVVAADCLAGTDELRAATQAFVETPGNACSAELAARFWDANLLRGDRTANEALQETVPDWQQHGFRATLEFMDGHLRTAEKSFETSLRLLRKVSGKRTAYFSDFTGVWYLLLLIFAETPDAKKIQRLLSQAERYTRPDVDGCLDLLERTTEFRSGIELGGGLRQWFEHEPWAQKLLVVLINHWFGRNDEGCLPEFQKMAQGLPWLQNQLDSIAGKTAEGFCLNNIYRPQQAWELRLEALRQLASPNSVIAKTIEPESRLVWFLDWIDGPGHASVDVKEQKRKGKGWTKGRAVALKRLSDNDVPCMDEADRRAADGIVLEVESSGWGHNEVYRFQYAKLLAGLVGHPRLFSVQNPEQQVELVQREPVLVVRKKKNQLTISLDPQPHNDGYRYFDWQLQSAGASRVEFVHFTDQHFDIDRLLGTDGLKLPHAAEETLLATLQSIAPMINVHSDIGGGTSAQVVQVKPAKTLFLFISPMGQGLHTTLAACPLGVDGPRLQPGRGVANVMGAVDGEQREAKRNLKREKEQLKKIQTEWPSLQDDGTYNASLPDVEDCLVLLEMLPQLNNYVTPVWPEGESLRLSEAMQPSNLSVSISSQQDWFALDGEVKVDNKLVLGMGQLLELMREHSSRFLPLGDGQYLNLTSQLRRQLQQLADASQADGKKQRLNPYAIAQLEGLEDAVGKFKAPRKWAAQAEQLRTAMASEPEVPGTFLAELRDYQLEGYRWLMRLAGWGAGAVLADDMGLGKTLQALSAMLAHAAEGPSLVVAPTSVAGNWISEAQRFAPTLKLHRVFSGSQLAKLETLGTFDVLITSYGIMQQGAEQLATQPWQMLVLDEAQAIKNAATKRAKAARLIPAKFRLALTGTPVENHLGDLWSLFAVTNPGLLGSAERFNKRYLQPIMDQDDDVARQSLRRLVQPFILRRTKQTVLHELPSRTEINLEVQLDDTERALYEAQRQQALARLDGSDEGSQAGHRQLQILAEITRLRRACCHPRLVMPNSPLPGAKLQRLLKVVEELRENRHRALVFSQFVDHLSIIREALDAAEVPYQYLDGSTPARKRDAAVKAFQAGEGDLFLISLKAGGFGLNLTAADYVIHMDPWWNPAVEDQASDRAHRMGQTRPVTIYRLITVGTIEEKILALHSRKRGLADSLLAGTDKAAKMDAEAVLELLREA